MDSKGQAMEDLIKTEVEVIAEEETQVETGQEEEVEEDMTT